MLDTINLWKNSKTDDKFLAKELKFSDKKLAPFFSSKLNFGTAGIRGIMGAGTSKINEFTIAAAADAFAKYLIKEKKINKGIVIGHDNRHNSKLYSLISARVFQANGIKSYLYLNNELQPTPVVSYTIRKMKLNGGIIITASHNPKEYNGFKVYNSLGQQLMPSETKKVSLIMDKINPLEIATKKWNENYVPDSIIDTYIKELLNIELSPIKNTRVLAVFSAQHGTAAKIAPKLINSLDGVSVEVVKKQQDPNPDFKYTKTPNPEDGKSYARASSLSKKIKADFMVTTDPDADRVGLAIKYKRRYKYLNGNDTAALYLNYKLEILHKQNKIPQDGYIVTTYVSGSLPEKIAKKYGLKVFYTHVGFKNIAEIIEKQKGSFIFAYEESYGMVINSNLTRDKDALQAIVGLTDMVRYYKSKNLDLYSVLLGLWNAYGVHRSTQISKVLDKNMTKRLLNVISKSKNIKIDGKKVKTINDFRKENINFVKAQMQDGTWFAVRPSGTEPKVKIYIETHGKPNQKLIDIVKYEKSILNWIENNTESIENKSWSWKGFLKYFIFVLIMIVILALVFTNIYRNSSGQSGGNLSLFKSVGEVITNNPLIRFYFFSELIWIIFDKLLISWRLKRMFSKQNSNVKLRHLLVSNIMGSIISFITPFAVGGDAVGYWYLRKKGYKRDSLASTFISNTILFQSKFIFQTIILLSIGIPIYKEIFLSNNIESNIAFIWFIIGSVWTIFSTFMIFSLILWKSFQENIVSKTVRLLEWISWVNITDPSGTIAKYQYEFYIMRKGVKTIWKDWWFALELIIYALIPVFFSPFTMVIIAQGWTSKDVAGVPAYWSTIVMNDIVNTTNSMSITPGGSGTGEWLDITTKTHLYDGNDFEYDPKGAGSAINLTYKLFYSWPYLLVSAMLIPTMITLETYRSKMAKINKNNKLRQAKLKELKPVKLYILLTWFIFITGYIIYFFLAF